MWRKIRIFCVVKGNLAKEKEAVIDAEGLTVEEFNNSINICLDRL